MLSNELRALAAPLARTMNLIWGAFLAATVFYGVIGAVVMHLEEPADAAGAKLLQIVFAGVAVVLAIASFLVQRVLLSPERTAERLRQRPGLSCLPGRDTAAMAANTERFGRLAESEQRLLSLVPFYQNALIIVWAIREAVAILGLVLTIMTAEPLACLPFVALGLLLLAIAPPRVATFLEQARGQLGGAG